MIDFINELQTQDTRGKRVPGHDIRFGAIYKTVLRFIAASKRTVPLDIVDLGCGTGPQCELWAERGHSVHGLDIDARLIATARQAANGCGQGIDYRIGSAGEAPWSDASMDVCLVVELLEHVADWERCIAECTRMLRPGGVVFISTTNRLCPRQQEFDLPLYSWYPRPLKRYYERLAVTSRPDLVHGTAYPAVHWFTPGQLCGALRLRGFAAFDRFDMMDLDDRSVGARALAGLIRAVPPLRWLAHVATSYSAAIGVKT